MKVIFTDYDTVKIDNNEEITTKDFFDFFEKSIKNGKITCCRYDYENEVFSYTYCEDKYFIKISSKNTRNLRILLTLMELENNESNNREKERISAEEKEELLKHARNGEIKSEEARQLYLKELKNDLNLFNAIKKFKSIQPSFCLSDKTLKILSVIYAIICLITGLIGTIFLILGPIPIWVALVMVVGGMFWALWTIEEVAIDSPSFIVALISNMILKTFKLISERKIIKHKIEWLKDYKLPSKKIDLSKQIEKSNTWIEYIEKHINNIHVKLAKLNEDDKKDLKAELEIKLEEYRTELLNIPKSGLTLDSEATISSRFILFLSEFNQRIDEKLSNQINTKPLDTKLEINQGNVLTSNASSGKVRKRLL